MKSLALIFLSLLLFHSCTQRYVTYDVIHKLQFREAPDKRPIAPMMVKSHQDNVKECFNQWLFFNNAEKEKDRYLPMLMQVLCPGSEWLLDTTVTQRWWTTIVFSQACVEVQASCPLIPKKK
jgi:hypothetical protein